MCVNLSAIVLSLYILVINSVIAILRLNMYKAAAESQPSFWPSIGSTSGAAILYLPAAEIYQPWKLNIRHRRYSEYSP